MSEETRVRLRRLLGERGVPEEEIAAAEAEDRLHLLVTDVLILPGARKYTADDIAELAGMPREQTMRYWRALGFPDVTEGARVFTDLDLDAISRLGRLLDQGLVDAATALQLSRVMGQSMARIAEAEIGATPAVARADGTDEAAELFAMAADATLDDVARLLEYSWRRHLRAAARRAMLRDPADVAAGTANIAVGFADLVGFTALSQQLSEEALAELVAHFEEVAHETVTRCGGRVVKMIGDEAMFVAGDPAAAIDASVELAAAYADDRALSDVRVGVACGHVLLRDGDYYGPVVNLASRIVNVASPGSVVAADAVRAAIGGDGRFEWKSLRPRYLKDIGRVPLWSVRRAGRREERGTSPLRRRARPLLALLSEAGREAIESAMAARRDSDSDNDSDDAGGGVHRSGAT